MSFAGRRQCKCPRWSFGFDRRPLRHLVVIQRHQNRSIYNGADYQAGVDRQVLAGRIEPSAWSHVLCTTCGAHWRTQARYPDNLPDLPEHLFRFCYGKLKKDTPADKALLDKINQMEFEFSKTKKSSPSARAGGLDSSRRPPRSRGSAARGKR